MHNTNRSQGQNDLTELQILGVPDSVSRFKREITPGQEGLLDGCSHVDAPRLHNSLSWLRDYVSSSVAGGVTTEVDKHLNQISTLMEWVGDIAEERYGSRPER